MKETRAGEKERYSVLMPVYRRDGAEWFAAALDSMIGQTLPPDEIVVVEDGELTEELYGVLDERVKRFPELFRIVKNETNEGLGPSLGKGMLACGNSLVARMDSDDIALPSRCEKQVRFMLEHPDVSIVGGQIAEFIDTTENIVGRRVVPEMGEELEEYIKRRCPLNHMTVMLRRDDVLSAGNYLPWFWNEDYYLWIRMALHGCRFANLPDVLVYARVGKDMYDRRGGMKYFKSEIAIQKLMLKKKMIGPFTFLSNCLKRLVVELLLPNRLRSFVYRRFARSR